MTAAAHPTHVPFRRRLLAVEGFLLAGVFLALGGCGEFAAQGRNAEGVRLFQQARYQEAMREFQEALYDDPNDADAYYNLAATYHRLGRLEHRQADLDQAECYYNQCLDRDPNHTDCYRGLAVLLAEQGRKDDAFRLVEGWVQRQPTSADAKIELARLNDEFGNRQAAKEQLIEALAADPDNPRALTALGKIREEAGDKAQALANYQRSLAEDDRQPEVASRVTALQGGPAVASDGFPSHGRHGHADGRPQLRAAEVVALYFRSMSWLTWPEPTAKVSSGLPGDSYWVGSGNHPSRQALGNCLLPARFDGFATPHGGAAPRWVGAGDADLNLTCRHTLDRVGTVRLDGARPYRLVGAEKNDRAVTDRAALVRHFARNLRGATAAANARQYDQQQQPTNLAVLS